MDRVWSEYDSSCLDWEDFAAQAIVPYWANDPSNMELRRVVAHRAMSGHYSAVALLTDTAFRHRDDLGEEFDRLISFIIRWAVIRHDINRSRRLQSDPVDVDEWFGEHGKAFIEGTMPSEWGNWGIEAVQQGEPYAASPNRSIIGSKRTSSGAAVHPRTDQTLIKSAVTNGRAPSWITTQSHLASRPSPAATESWRRLPPRQTSLTLDHPSSATNRRHHSSLFLFTTTTI